MAEGGPDPAVGRGGVPVYERVASVLRRGIVAGTLAGGTRLVQPRIAAALGVSVTPVREALRRLAAEGLVQLDESGGAVVHELSQAELVEVYELRRLLEPLAVTRAAKEASEVRLVEAVELVAAMHEVRDVAIWSEINTRFHSVIEEAGCSPQLAAILRRLRALSALYVTHSLLSTPERVEAGNAEHREILEAVIANDPEAAAAAVERHLEGTLRTLLEVREVDGHRFGARADRWWGRRPPE
ncbi:GntR family transcriptional regulator [Aciditerrimonas ferrireducens]|jgi:DNA-binding GntR family transcriptional regulator|uniref:GntR family transcriptional regulator n=1 Tax=Aciditerrimonas ferrireducens TaxID=667306 RepID=A0ABV6BZB2_9ACTN